ncbi:MAG TPA: hypothetical protein VHC86_12405 [Opitutaceae bacterium]|nr:hypothetical protein [Opitutaceae bacterium]
MRTASLDLLEKSELPLSQARAILQVLEEEMALSQENLATRADIDGVRADMAALLSATRAEMAALRSAIQADIAKLRSATQADIAELRLVLHADMGELRLSTKSEIQVFVAALRAEMLERFGRLEARFGQLEGRLTRWVFTCILGQTGVLAGLGWFLIAHYRR